MTPERWKQIDQIFEAALELAVDKRSAFLEEACAGDDELRKEVETLLSSEHQAGSSIDGSPKLIAANLIAQSKGKLSGALLAGRYQIISSLGAGGMGEVYREKDLRLDRDVAIKVLPESLAANPDALSRFEREAKAVAALSHPNILSIHDFASDNGVSFAVMELLEGETLRQHINASPFSWRKAVEIAVPIAEGLAAAHSRGVIHRDLKPENIFLTKDGQIKILDFGLAQWKRTTLEQELSTAKTESQLTQSGMVMGTVPYMSPEQVRGIPVDARSDIFSFGSVLYEILSGTRAFSGNTAADTLAAILKEPPKDRDALRKKIPEGLDRTITHCLEKNPEQRFQTAQDLAFDLKAILSGSSTIVQERPKTRNVWIALMIVALMILGGIIFYKLNQLKPIKAGKEIQSLAILPFTNVGGDSEREYLSEGITESIINSLSQLPGLRVIARGTVFTYSGKDVDPRKVGRDLNVETVVTGRVFQQGDTLVVNADLVKVDDGTSLWGQKYNRKVNDAIEVQEAIANEIAQTLRSKLTGEQKKIISKRYTENPEAYQLYLRGMHHWWKSTEEDNEKARDYFQQAIELDPAYALAYAGLGDYYLEAASDYLPPRDAWPKAEAAFHKALEIDDSLAIAYRGLAKYSESYLWNWPEAERQFKRAFELDPKNPLIHFAYAWFLLTINKVDQAIAEMQVASKQDPLSRNFSLQVGQMMYIKGRYQDAIKQLKNTIELDPDYEVTHLSLADVYEQIGNYDEAILESQKAYQLMGDDETAELYGKAKGEAGYHDLRERIERRSLENLKEYAKTAYVSPLVFAGTYAHLGDKDEAFQWLEKAYEDRSVLLVQLKVSRDWDNIRSDPRFTDLVNRIGLP